MKHLVTRLLLLSLCLMMLWIPALAEEEKIIDTVDARDGIFNFGGFPEQGAGISAGTTLRLFAMRRTLPTLEDYLFSQIMAGVEKIDLRDYGLMATWDDEAGGYVCKELLEAFQNIVNMHGELFFLDGKYKMGRTASNKVVSFEPGLLYTAEQRETMLEIFDAGIEKIVAYALSCSDDDLGQVMAVNDYICRHFQYDDTYTNRDVYSFLTEGKGVCQAYMTTVCTVLQRLGIPVTCFYNDDPSVNHTWNAVQIDGKWYQLDVTWNDTTPDYYGYVDHQFLLMSMTASAERKHGSAADITGPVSTTDTRFDNMFWNSVTHSFLIEGNDYYFVRPVKDNPCHYELVKWNSESNTFTTITSDPFASYWPYNPSDPTDHRYYPDYGGAVGRYQGYLLYTTADGVYAIAPTGGAARKIFTIPSGCISGCFFENDTLYYGIGNHVSKQTSRGNEWPISLGDLEPIATPTPTATVKPTVAPTATVKPTAAPTATVKPTAAPTATVKPTAAPTATVKPTAAPNATVKPTVAPTATVKPTAAPTATAKPAAPKIAVQPKSQYVVEGQTATFEIAASGTGLSYQWYVNYNDGKGWHAISGANGYRYTTSATTLGCDGYQYFCHVRDAAGQTANSVAAKLHVGTVPATPSTGDGARPLLWSLLLLMGCAGLILAVRRIRRS